MDSNFKTKITQNFRVVKERISVDINFFVDRLIETGIFTLEIKDEINNVQPPTPDNKADVFITKLIGCGNMAFEIFKKILQERGCTDLTDLMENTGQENNADNGDSGYTEETGTPFDQVTTMERMPTDKNDNLAYMNALLAEHMKPLTQSVKALEKKLEASEEARDAERKLYQEKWEAAEQSRDTDRKLYEERSQSMHEDILKLQNITEELQRFREMYQYAREQLSQKSEKCYKLFRENKDIKNENMQIKTEIDVLKSEYDLLSNAQKELHDELDELATLIKERENEIERLRIQINKNYNSKQQPLISVNAEIALNATEGISNTSTNQTNTPRKAINNKPKKVVCKKANMFKK